MEKKRSTVSLAVLIENLFDAYAGDDVRRVRLSEVVLDRRVPQLLLPTPVIRQLGLIARGRHREGRTVYDPVRLFVAGNSCATDVLEAPEEPDVVLGWIMLGQLGLVHHPETGTLIDGPSPLTV